MFRKVLVANRGEIAVRVLRACRNYGIATVAVYSEADAGALHVALADEAYPIGPPPARESYLVGERIIEVALRAGVEAIHPGYGFLSENAGFARAVREAGLTFIGPSAEAMEQMASKTAARELMARSGVPVIPGHPAGSDQELAEAAARLGLPVVVKAVAGGGGKGMRVVRRMAELEEALRTVRLEARHGFGDDRLYLERYLDRPRHIEVQILGDQDGRIVHLFERDCSVQRRHQKIIEESPSPGLSEELRAQLGEAAGRAAEAVSYEGAGTVEFLLDEDGSFYFLEMNTRLQVEHAVTELVTGVDLVRAQLSIASGASLRLLQKELKQRGHAIECRIYAEDPANGFAPSTGPIHHAEPPLGPHVRVDTGVTTGDVVTVFYDPLLSKVVCWGESRAEAIRTMRQALRRYAILGPLTNIEYLLAVLDDEGFCAGRVHTGFVAEHLAGWRPRRSLPEDVLVLAAVADHIGFGRGQVGQLGAGEETGEGDPYSPWRG